MSRWSPPERSRRHHHHGGRPVRGTLAAWTSAAALAWSVLSAPAALAAGERSGYGEGQWGARVGVSSAPGQVVLGVHHDSGEIARWLRFVPNADLGVGDHRTLLTINPDLICAFPLEGDGAVYVGGSVGVVWRTDRRTGPGVAGILGYLSRWSGRLVFLDAKIRISDSYPGVKLTIGTNLGR